MRYGLASVSVAACFLGLSAGADDAAAGASKECRPPADARSPMRAMKTVDGPSCGAARRVARVWDRSCVIPYTDGMICRIDAAGGRWSCRTKHIVRFDRTSPDSQPVHTGRVSVLCALPETGIRRPAVKFIQVKAVRECQPPNGTRSQLSELYGYHAASCSRAREIAAAWDRSCQLGDDRAVCSADAWGETWRCEQWVSMIICSTAAINNGCAGVTFRVAGYQAAPGSPEAGGNPRRPPERCAAS